MRSYPQLNAPFHYPLAEGLTEIEVTDPRHPLFGRRFKVFSWPTSSRGAGFVTVIYRDPMRLRIPLSATDLTPPRQGGLSKLTLATPYEVLCPSPLKPSGSGSPRRCKRPSSKN